MAEERIAILDLAEEMRKHKQTLFKVARRLGIKPTRRREEARCNQLIATVTRTEAAAIRTELSNRRSPRRNDGSADAGLQPGDDIGVFYVIRLEPEIDPGRFKVGFGDMDERLRKHRCSAPYAERVKTWACRRTWERAAIDCVTAGCEHLREEVYRAPSLAEVVERADAFFCRMPKVAA